MVVTSSEEKLYNPNLRLCLALFFLRNISPSPDWLLHRWRYRTKRYRQIQNNSFHAFFVNQMNSAAKVQGDFVDILKHKKKIAATWTYKKKASASAIVSAGSGSCSGVLYLYEYQ